ncbi:MAG: hypothetical protein H6739_38145 [Alphaproteobacteria bacterium]|nr:hypothetical protein [Alphaproteobacteria bacterium]
MYHRGPLTALTLAALVACQGDDLDGDGYGADEDCAALNITIHPDAVEVCDAVDNDCDGAVDEGWFQDSDRDGYGAGTWDCVGTDWAVEGGDCDDSLASISPGRSEQPYNGLDDDCDEATPDDDLDADGYGLDEDCDDQDPSITPETEVVWEGDLTWRGQAEAAGVNHITGHLELHDSMDSFEGLESLCRVDGIVLVSEHPSLIDLSGLSNLTFAGGVELTYNTSQVSLEGLERLVYVEDRLLVSAMPNRAFTMQGVDALVHVGYLYLISNVMPDFTGLEGLRSAGRVTINGGELASLDGLDALEVVEGQFELAFMPPTLESVDGLPSLTEIGGELWVSDNQFLVDLPPMSSLQRLGSLKIEGNQRLNALDGLTGLRSVDGNVTIIDNQYLSSAAIQAFLDRVDVGGEVTQRDNGD